MGKSSQELGNETKDLRVERKKKKKKERDGSTSSRRKRREKELSTTENEDEFPPLRKEDDEHEPQEQVEKEEETPTAKLQRLVKEVDGKILRSLIRITRTTEDEGAVGRLADDIQQMRGITVDLIARVAELEGELVALKSNPQRSFAEVTKSTSAGQHHDPGPREEGEKRKQSVLHIRLTNKGEKDAAKVAEEELKKNFEPAQLGLRNVSLRRTREGVLVLADEKEGLERLKSELEEHGTLRGKLTAEFPQVRQPEICIVGVPGGTPEEDIQKEIAKQTNTEEEQIRIKRTMRSPRRTEVTVIAQLPGPAFRNIMERGRVRLGWTMLKAYENLYVPRCDKCARLGHPTVACRQKDPTCTDCTGNHNYKDCPATEFFCQECVIYNRRVGRNVVDIGHSMRDRRCPSLKRFQEGLRERTNYE